MNLHLAISAYRVCERKALSSPQIYLSHIDAAPGSNVLRGARGVARLPVESAPALLISFVYLKGFLKARAQYVYRQWMLDSGAFSASTFGTTINLDEYIATSQELLSADPTLKEVLSLDVIGNWRAGIANAEKMWAAGVEAIPTWHAGEPEDLLVSLARDYPKIALGGLVPLKGAHKHRVCARAFDRVWPKKIHGLGCGSRKLILALPWHSVDAANWQVGPTKFGRWESFGGKMSVRGSAHNLRSEVEFYLRLEREARSRWAREMARLEGA